MEKLGINPILFGFQVLNFIIILILLNYLVFRPLSKILEQRKKKIEAGLAKEGEATTKLAEIEVEKQKKLTVTNDEIGIMMSEAAKKANKIKEDILKEARAEVESLTVKSKERLEAEKEQMIDDARSQIADLAVIAVEKVFKDGGAKEIKEKLNQKAIDKLWQKQKK